MLTNYLKIALRTLRKQRVYALLNVVGLAVGLAACLLIVAYVWHELHYDRFHARADRIYRVSTRIRASGSDDGVARTGVTIGPLLKQYPEVRETVRLKPVAATVRRGAELVNEKAVFYADPSVLTVFSYPLLRGDRRALDQPNSIVLTETLARKYFQSVNPLGRVLRVNDEAYRVTGVLADVPSNADLSFTALLSWRETADERADWLDTSCFTYLLFGSAEQAAAFAPKLTRFSEVYFGTRIRALGVFDFKVKNELHALTDLHFVEGLDEDTPKGSRTSLLIFGGIAGLLLLVACINYVNLYVAQSLYRQKEVGVRKVLGAGRRQVAAQFLAESALLIGLSAGLALVLAQGISPVFQQFTEKSGVALTGGGWPLLAGGAAVLLFVGLLTSSYPAFYLARFAPTRVLKGPSVRPGKPRLRQVLVVVQFSIAIGLIAGTLLVYRQLRYLHTKNPGFQREQVLVVQVPDEDAIRQKMTTLRRTLAADSRIEGVSTGHPPINLGFKASFVKETNGQKLNLFIQTALVDESYLDVLKLRLRAGRNFTGPTDREQAVLVNEAFVRWMGWSEAVGRKLNPSAPDSLTARVVGVVKDFHYQSLHHRIEPLVLYFGGDRPVSLLVRVKPEHLRVVRQAWAALVPERPFTYTFLDDSYQQQYRREEKLMTLIGWFSTLTVFISCLGLFGLTTFTAEQRTKEIGIRKVLGASVFSLVALLSKDFLKLVFVAILLATPLAWYLMNAWLQEFAYKIDIDGWVFAGAGVLAVGVALLTVSFQSVKAALTNPVKSLRTD